MSQETKNTPGPWRVCGGYAPPYICIATVAEPHRPIVWQFADLRVEGQDAAPGYEEQRANARLIAAAPDLLAACVELCRRLEVAELVNRPHMPGNEYDQPAYDRAKAAIAKARGAQ